MNAKLIDETRADKPAQTYAPPEEPLTAIPTVQLAEEPGARGEAPSTLGLVELLLKNPTRLDALINHDEKRQSALIPRFLSIALASYVLFSIAMIVILNVAQPQAHPHRLLPVPEVTGVNRSALGLLVAYNFGLVAATCICLPSFYFFSLLAGVRLSMLQIVGQVLRSKVTSAIVLVGILPIYVAVVLGMIVFEASEFTLECWLYLGLVLPFLAGLEGVRCIYRGVMGMAQTMPPDRRCRRECFLRRLTFGWAACYTAVSPVLIYRLWELLA